MRTQSFWSASLLAIMLLFVGAGATVGTQAQQAGEPWIHLHIDREGDDQVTLNLPLAAIEAARALAPTSIVENGQLQLGQEHEVPVAAIRAMWQELRGVGDVEFATIQHEGNDVRIAREGDTILVRVSEGDTDEDVRVEVPVPVVDALLSGDGDMLNIRAAIQELSTMRGEMVRVIEANNNIRVWIDETPTQ